MERFVYHVFIILNVDMLIYLEYFILYVRSGLLLIPWQNLQSLFQYIKYFTPESTKLFVLNRIFFFFLGGGGGRFSKSWSLLLEACSWYNRHVRV